MSRRAFFQVLWAATTIALIFLSAGGLFAQGRSDEAFEHVKAVQERHTESLLARPGVVGTAIGLDGNGRHVVLVLLEKEGVPDIPADLDGVAVRRRVTGAIYALPKPSKPPGTDVIPEAPTNLVAVADGARIDLTWKDNSRNESGFRVERSDGGGGFAVRATTRKNATSYSDTVPDRSQEYIYRVYAFNNAGDSSPSNEASVPEGSADTPPGAPTGLTATPAGSYQIDLDWADNPTSDQVIRYDVYRREASGSYGGTPTASVTASSYSDTGLTASTMYYYVVRAVNAVGPSGASEEVSATTGEPPDTEPPAAPTDLNATKAGSSQINLTWTDQADNETGFKVERKTGTTSFEQIAFTGANVTVYSDSGLNPSTTYIYRVCAYNDAGNSGYSNEDSATTDEAPVPTDPTDRFPRPVPIGVSTGHPSITAGTIGCRVKDSSGNVYALSNNHVYAASNAADIGDAVIQPGTYDHGASPGDDIGTLAEFEPIAWYPWGINLIDAAIASTTTSLVGKSTPSGGYGTPNSTTTTGALGMAVQKYGRTTGLTTGTVEGVNAAILVSYGPGQYALFAGQIMITPGDFSGGGDSGSLIVTGDTNCNPVGLLFAGSTAATYANPIDSVLDHFGVTIDGK